MLAANNATAHHGPVHADLSSMAPVPGASSMPANEVLADRMAASGYGWTGRQTVCLNWLWTRESAGTWSPTVANPYSGALGIPQSLPPDKMASAGPDWRTSAATQIRWGLGYVDGRYVTPCGAWAHETQAGWY
jgi:hypothetical protein